MKKYMVLLINYIHKTNKRKKLMKALGVLITMFLVMILFIACPAQPKSDYEVVFTPTSGAVKHLVFYEEKVVQTGFQLVDGMDYLNPNVSALKITELTDPASSFTISLNNDGKYVVVGVVAVDAAGFYSSMGVSAVTQKGTIPSKPAGIIFRKK